MTRRISSAVATGALIACSICHVWTLLQVLRSFANEGERDVYTGPGVSFVLLYMAAVCLFNWYALTSGSQTYRRVALMVTTLHLVAALLQGAAAEAVRMTGQGGDSWIMTAGVIVPSVFNLPMDSTRVIGQLSSLIPWWTSVFFAINLAVVILRLRRMPVSD